MSFAAPLYLIGLVLLPVLLAAYLLGLRTRRRAARAFAAPRLTESVTPNRPGWRRHAPMLAFALAVLVLVLAAARPQLRRTVAVENLSTLLALDMSGSMQASDILPNRASAAQHAADVFVTGVPARVSIGVMQFNQTPTLLQSPTRKHDAVFRALSRLRIGGGTSIGGAIHEALAILPRSGDPGGRGVAAVIVLLSDGKSTSGPDPLAAAREAARLHVPIYTVSLGTPGGTIAIPRKHGGTVQIPVPPDPAALAEVAHASGGRAYTAADADHLSAIYHSLSVQLAHHREAREITAYLAGGGLLLLLLGSALSLTWFARPI
jgi:Ca-activated chloride channel homolog